jgi:hypothetical protein
MSISLTDLVDSVAGERIAELQAHAGKRIAELEAEVERLRDWTEEEDRSRPKGVPAWEQRFKEWKMAKAEEGEE